MKKTLLAIALFFSVLAVQAQTKTVPSQAERIRLQTSKKV
jgi:hypothetical protein